MQVSTDLSGKRFGRLVVLRRHQTKSAKNSSWLCKCDCGVAKVVARPCLIQCHTLSCGCLNSDQTKEMFTTHGMTNTRTYRTWTDIKTRCTNSRQIGYKNYGGRGISVCRRWKEFRLFYKDMGNAPDDMSIERIDNSKGYSPSNCKWATLVEQANNRRTNVTLTHNAKSQNIAQWADELHISRGMLYARIANGWNANQALTIPSRGSIKSITYNGTTKTLKAWSLELSENSALVSIRLKRGWSQERAVTTKARWYPCQST